MSVYEPDTGFIESDTLLSIVAGEDDSARHHLRKLSLGELYGLVEHADRMTELIIDRIKENKDD